MQFLFSTKNKIYIIIGLLLVETVLFSRALADYQAIGEFSGTVCSGLFIKDCSWVSVDAVEKGGKLFNIKRNYSKVTEYHSIQELCHIKINKKNQNFYSKTSSGQFKKVLISTLSFKCRKY